MGTQRKCLKAKGEIMSYTVRDLELMHVLGSDAQMRTASASESLEWFLFIFNSGMGECLAAAS